MRIWCGRPDLNRHGKLLPRDFKSLASTISPRPRERTAITCSAAMGIYGASAGMTSLVAALISLLVGLEAGTLRRFTLKRRGWRNVGVVSGSDLEDAEHRFFAAWVNGAKPQANTPPAAPPPASPATPLTTAMASYMPPVSALTRTLRQPAADSSGVIGLFPEPGAQR